MLRVMVSHSSSFQEHDQHQRYVVKTKGCDFVDVHVGFVVAEGREEAWERVEWQRG